jgi:hypothetical protein
MDLIATLNKHGHLPPDEIVPHLSDPLIRFVKIVDISEELFERWQNRPIAFYRFEDGRPCWDSMSTAEHVNKSFLKHFRDSPWPSMQRSLYNWAIIGYEHRLRPDLEFPT